MKSMRKKNLTNKLDKLINNKNYLIKYQKLNFKDFYLTHEHVTEIIDNARNLFLRRLNVVLKKDSKNNAYY